MKCSEMFRILTKAGWFPISQKGSHIKLKHNNKPGILVFPNHGSHELAKGMANKIKMTLEKTDTGFSAYAEKYPIFTTGKTIAELLDNAFEAARLYFDEEDTKTHLVDIKFEIDFEQFFKYYRVLNSRFLAERIGMHPTLLSQYVQGRKKPSDAQTEKILLGIHKIGQELSEIKLIQK